MPKIPEFCEERSFWDRIKGDQTDTINLPDIDVANKEVKNQPLISETSQRQRKTLPLEVSLVRLLVWLCICLTASWLVNSGVRAIFQPKSTLVQYLLEFPLTLAILFLGLRYGVWAHWKNQRQQLEEKGATWKSQVDGLESAIIAHHKELANARKRLEQQNQENDKLERQLLQKHRLENIGTLATGVAHDLNNALAPIVMSTELLYDFYPRAGEYVETIETCARRGAGMVQQLLTYAKGVEGEKICVLPGHLIKEMESIVSRTFPTNIELVTDYTDDLNAIHGEATQIHQVLLNLCVNARDAMPTGGMLALRSENVEIGKGFDKPTILQAKPGQYVACHVRDTGKGISKEMMSKMFKPFVSSKERGKGSGIGLSTVINILKSHQGFLTIQSEVGKGSTFSVYFPACEPIPIEPPSLQSQKETTQFKGNNEVILIVDDDAEVRKTLAILLGSLNFRVMTATSSTDAIVQATDYRADIYAIITDFHMPHIGGLVFLRLLRQMLPETPLMVTSGNFESDDLEELKHLGVSKVMEKPFTKESLIQNLADLSPRKS